MGVVAVFGFVFHMRSGNRNPTRFLFGSFVNLLVIGELSPALLCQHLGDGSSQSRLAVVYMTNRANVAVWLVALKLLFRHKARSPRLRSVRRHERVMGIEPTQPAWKAGALPLSYTRVAKRGVVEGAGFEPA